jgi:ATP/maltotriose-dependent transcriptional regulator MalT
MRLALALALVNRGREARLRIDEGLSHAREVGGAFRIADAEVHAGAAMLYLDDPSSAVSHLEGAIEGLREIGERSVLSTAAALAGEALFRLDRLEEAQEAANLSREMAADDDQASQMAWRQVSAKVLARRGSMPEASALIAEAVEIADSTDFLTMAALAHLDASEVAVGAGRLDKAQRERAKAIQLLKRKGASTHLAGRDVMEAAGT